MSTLNVIEMARMWRKIFLSALIPSLVSATTLDIQWFTSESDPLAVCNDGSPGAYYFNPATDEAMMNWFVIFLPGGGQCYDEASCSDRWNNVGLTYMSSKEFTITTDKSGLLDSDPAKSPLYGANKASLGYCSSDGYMGDAGASAETWNWHFRGQRLVHAMIIDLKQRRGLNENSTIILAGASAGARGMMTLSRTLINEWLPTRSRVALFLDSPYYLDLVPYSKSFIGFPYEEQQKFQHVNTSAVVHEDCSSAYGAEEYWWKCQFGQYRMPFVNDIPYLLIASQYDSYQLENNMQESAPYHSDSAVQYAEDFAQQIQTQLRALIDQQPAERNTTNAYMSWACFNHAISDTAGFSTVRTEAGVSQQDALTLWLATYPFVVVGPATSSRAPRSSNSNMEWIDACTGFACGKGCIV